MTTDAAKLKIGDEYTLTEKDDILVNDISRKRTLANNKRRDATQNNNQKMSESMSWEQIEKDGFAGEVAYCRMANTRIDKTTHVRNSKNDAGDTVLSRYEEGGWKTYNVDVKTTNKRREDFLTPVYKVKNEKIQLYASMLKLDEKTFRFMGYVTREELMKKKKNVMVLSNYILMEDLKEYGDF